MIQSIALQTKTPVPPAQVEDNLRAIVSGQATIPLPLLELEDFAVVNTLMTGLNWKTVVCQRKNDEKCCMYCIKQTITDLGLPDLRREAYLLCTLPQHPNIINCYGGNLSSRPAFIVLESTLMGTLRSQLTHMPKVGLSKAWTIAQDIAAGLFHLHTFRWGHFDVNPSNILIRADYSVVLANFGLAVMVPKYGPGFFGTLAYLAPEYHVNGDVLWDTTADVYALGVMMIELMNGVDPFAGLDNSAITQAVTSGKQPQIYEEPTTEEQKYFVRLAVQCTARDASSRPTIETVFKSLQSRKGCFGTTSGPTTLLPAAPKKERTNTQPPLKTRSLKDAMQDKSGVVNVNKLIFQSPATPSYDWSTPNIIKIQTAVGDMPCRLIECKSSNVEWFILYFHGNGYDIGGIQTRDLEYYANSVNAHIMLFEYPGYGQFKSDPTAFHITNCAITAYHFLENTLRFPAERIVLHGHSVGCGPVLEVAQAYALLDREKYTAPIILQSSYLSLKEVAKGMTSLGALMTDRWINSEMIAHVNGPILFIHGEEDKITFWDGAKRLMDLCSSPEKQKCWIPKVGHDIPFQTTISAVKAFLSRLPVLPIPFPKSRWAAYSKR
eukprot:TRINITY_DN2277_c0_g1_i2.p1 TRINITY_DN2277_c0_g1~~TRINITY_DN2277_c0_g1_i2.p1  ORF type:complete len:607 (+),score=140.57 TRINITY_DN2277_c0_g1_i2:323-2143(+)